MLNISADFVFFEFKLLFVGKLHYLAAAAGRCRFADGRNPVRRRRNKSEHFCITVSLFELCYDSFDLIARNCIFNKEGKAVVTANAFRICAYISDFKSYNIIFFHVLKLFQPKDSYCSMSRFAEPVSTSISTEPSP